MLLGSVRSNDEAGHPGQQRHRFSDVPRAWNSKIEQDRQVVALAQFLA
jgi:hypothetical protein